ncbi:MAG TPA: single-stranded-DNA-specific exonuclease RecJ [Solirubrobacteraceae bacterium]|nr:single-stranded-DNA-specific exonuclease RecJ [Solirubrobacteraceae bacterium]
MIHQDARLTLEPYEFAAVERLAQQLGVSGVLAQVLVRRGMAEPAAARAFLEAADEHPLDAFGGLREAAERILGHVRRAGRITVHGDYDVDGVTASAVLIRALRTVGADVDWYLPSRSTDGYGLAAATVDRLAERGTDLLITVDCAITAVEEVARARAAGMDVIVTDHHSPRADGRLPDAPIVHPRIGGYPCADLCAAAVAHKLAQALLEAHGEDPRTADEDLDLVALATVADVVPLLGENRRLVRQGLRKLASTRKPGLRALMDVAKVDPSTIDAGAIGFRLGPRLNAAGRLYRADAGLELLLTEDRDRARAVALELDANNTERRDVETRIRFEAEAQVAKLDPTHAAAAYVLASDGWHAGVIGIVAARIAERHHRPCVLIALDGAEGTGSGRSIPGFDLLGGLHAASETLQRYGGHRAAAGLTIHTADVPAFREAFAAHAASVLTPEDMRPEVRVDAVAPGDALTLSLAEELEQLAPFGQGNPAVSLLVPAALLDAPRPMGEGRHVAFTLAAGGARSRCVMFGAGTKLPAEPTEPVQAVVRLERNHWNGTTEPRLILRHAHRAVPRGIEVIGEPPFLNGVHREIERDLTRWIAVDVLAAASAERTKHDVRGRGIAGVLADLVASGEDVLAVTAHAPHRAGVLRDRVGGFALCSWQALEDDPGLAARFVHVVAVDPPTRPGLDHLSGQGWTHVAWGEPELQFAARIHQWDFALRDPLAAVYRALRAARSTGGEACEALLRGEGPQPRSAALAGRLVRVLSELGLVDFDREGPALRAVEAPERTALERSAAFRAYHRRLEDGLRFLTSSPIPIAA